MGDLEAKVKELEEENKQLRDALVKLTLKVIDQAVEQSLFYDPTKPLFYESKFSYTNSNRLDQAAERCNETVRIILTDDGDDLLQSED